MVRGLISGWFCVLFGLVGFICVGFVFVLFLSFPKVEILTMILSFVFLIRIIGVPLSSLSVVFVANVLLLQLRLESTSKL